ncbi:MAG: indole-3-glycerol phosphate synthase TrpC [Deltaproteobacteria bacterium]|nr:indole-3-glycerol phosphate synthase TrpC [Deltaproteobacteria bacterium]MBW2659044.1 indole-3-glycerol phosphate synthase TrpC [Deltaproteobacteria bacterium]
MILDRIVERKREEVAELRAGGIVLPESFRERKPPPPRDFLKAVTGFAGVSIIAEVKKASPSKGVICENFQPVRIAEDYQKNGAQAISVLTDVDFFQGSLLYMMQVREAVILPVLRKDFIIDELQIEEANLHGADAVLLIAAILDSSQLQDYRQCAGEYGMDVLVEVHDEHESEMAVESGADLIGINNRNLNDFSVNIDTTFRLNRLIPDDIPVVSESGLRDGDDIKRLAEASISAALIGESLMRAGTDSGFLKTLRAGW